MSGEQHPHPPENPRYTKPFPRLVLATGIALMSHFFLPDLSYAPKVSAQPSKSDNNQAQNAKIEQAFFLLSRIPETSTLHSDLDRLGVRIIFGKKSLITNGNPDFGRYNPAQQLIEIDPSLGEDAVDSAAVAVVIAHEGKHAEQIANGLNPNDESDCLKMEAEAVLTEVEVWRKAYGWFGRHLNRNSLERELSADLEADDRDHQGFVDQIRRYYEPICKRLASK